VNLELLTSLKRFLVDYATEQGICLNEQFGTMQKFDVYVFAIAVKGLMDQGMSCKEATNAMLGDGAYDRLAGQLWDRFQAEKTKVGVK
jgi:hypothetical protein